MEWSSGDKWSVEVGLEPGQYDFKAVVMRQDGSIAEWEGGDNRTIEVHATAHHALFSTAISPCDMHALRCSQQLVPRSHRLAF